MTSDGILGADEIPEGNVERRLIMKTLISAALAVALLGTAGAANAATFYGHDRHGDRVVVRTHAPHRAWVRGERFIPGRAHVVMVNDWRGFGLHRPFARAHWVRVGPDFLLINNRTGRIMEVVPRY
jgi:hypothetical protein